MTEQSAAPAPTPHKQRTILVRVDVDEGVADLVLYLNAITGIRTHASCQGTIGEGGAQPFRPQVMVTWANREAYRRLLDEFDMSDVHHDGAWCYVHPRAGWKVPGSFALRDRKRRSGDYLHRLATEEKQKEKRR